MKRSSRNRTGDVNQIIVHRAGKSGGTLGKRKRRFGVYKMQGISCLAEELS
jgi:hypothetical protein